VSKELPPLPSETDFPVPKLPEPSVEEQKAALAEFMKKIEGIEKFIEQMNTGMPAFVKQIDARFKALEERSVGGSGGGGGGWMDFGKSIVDLIRSGIQMSSGGGGGGFGAEMESMGREIIKGNLKELIWMTKERAKALGITEGAGQVIPFKKP